MKRESSNEETKMASKASSHRNFELRIKLYFEWGEMIHIDTEQNKFINH